MTDTIAQPVLALPFVLHGPVSHEEDESGREIEKELFNLCKQDDWEKMYEVVEANPSLGTTNITMDNNITTTICHQAITSKGNKEARAKVINLILTNTPKAAAIKNGYKSLPLHVICQRNTHLSAKIKTHLIRKLIDSYPGALVEKGGTGGRTPLHIVFTDYINPALVEYMIQNGNPACRMKDSKGWLPIHVACSRHCSPKKLELLLDAYPESLNARTGDKNMSLMDLVKSSATKSHPNYALIQALNQFNEKGTNLKAPKRAKKKKPSVLQAGPDSLSPVPFHAPMLSTPHQFHHHMSPVPHQPFHYSMFDPSMQGFNRTYYGGPSSAEEAATVGATGSNSFSNGSSSPGLYHSNLTASSSRSDFEPIAYSPQAGRKRKASENEDMKAAACMLLLRDSTEYAGSPSTRPRVSTSSDGGDIGPPSSPDNVYVKREAGSFEAPFPQPLNNNGGMAIKIEEAPLEPSPSAIVGSNVSNRDGHAAGAINTVAI